MFARSRLRAGAVAVLLLTSASAGFAQTSNPGTKTSPAASALFDFHSSFWVNLHQTLFREAAVQDKPEDRKRQAGVQSLDVAVLSPEEQQIWQGAVGYYEFTFAGRRLLFDPGLIRFNDSLATEADSADDLGGTGLPPDYIAILRRAALVYRKYWWSQHDKANREWIAAVQAQIEKPGPGIAARLEDILKARWSSQPLRVDVAYYVAELGMAYTTDHPPHTTISSGNHANHGLSGFEILFHEASHTLSGSLESALQAECSTQKKDCGDLWHAVLFYPVGEVARTTLGQAGNKDYVPYAYHFGLYQRGDWPRYRRSLEQNWQPYLDGKTDWQNAIKTL